jgi:hypothetical protein
MHPEHNMPQHTTYHRHELADRTNPETPRASVQSLHPAVGVDPAHHSKANTCKHRPKDADSHTPAPRTRATHRWIPMVGPVTNTTTTPQPSGGDLTASEREQVQVATDRLEGEQ